MGSRPKKKAKVRGEAQQPALPGLEPSSAWQKMKSTPKRQRQPVERVTRKEAGPGHPSWRNEVVPGKCTCGDRKMEGELVNPWVLGHAYWCSMFMQKCEWCRMTGGTHKQDCQFWTLHPEITPF